METKYRKRGEITVTLGRLTCKRVSDLLDQLANVDPDALRMAKAALPIPWRRIIVARANMSLHPARPDLARKFRITEEQVAYRELKGLYRLCREFEKMSGYRVTVER